jgi:shikimate kinase
MSIVLIGYRGSGKSTVGRKLADRLWQTFVDTDDLIVRRAGKSIKAIFEEDGEPAFRELETAVLKEALLLEDHVIALGGGAVLREENREAVRSSGHRVLYLKCDPKVLAQRIAADPNSAASRPALSPVGSSAAEVEQVLAQREPLYRSTMHAELDVTNLSPDDAVVYLVRMM